MKKRRVNVRAVGHVEAPHSSKILASALNHLEPIGPVPEPDLACFDAGGLDQHGVFRLGFSKGDIPLCPTPSHEPPVGGSPFPDPPHEDPYDAARESFFRRCGMC